ncbi:TPR end-of-group domain-containing protein [Tautonia rosea]|uniref:TPR end-of-group domain-containing protein n=1 Tax=Tautonia rosea TaxID=2728037 RepID=UPI001472A285|nr:hypothetical protein [Tautonia rosea]
MPYLNRSAEVGRMLLELDPPPNNEEQKYISATFYNEACNLALEGDIDLALDRLREALELGFSDPIIWGDPELDALSDRSEFQELLDQYRDQLSLPEPDATDVPIPESP